MSADLTPSWMACIVLVIPLIVVALAARYEQYSWFSPGALFALVWTAFVVMPLILVPGISVWPGTIIAVMTAVSAVYIGSVVGRGGLFVELDSPKGRIRSTDRGVLDNLPALGLLTALGSAIGLVGVVVLVRSESYSIADLLSFDAFSVMARAFSLARYEQGYNPPVSVRIMTVGMYTAALFGGALFATGRTRGAWTLAFVPFLPALLFMAVLTTRAVFLFQVVLWLSSCMAVSILREGARKVLFTRFRLLLFAVLFLCAAMVVSLVLMARHGNDFDALVAIAWFQLRGDAVGHLPAFGDWLQVALHREMPLTYGAFTFGGLFEALNIQERFPGIYEENIELQLGGAVVETNIYTAFRGLIQDFGVPGALGVLFTLGMLGGWFFRKVAMQRLSSVPFLTIFYALAIWSPIGSITVYNTLLAALAMFSIYIFAVPVLQRAQAVEAFSRSKRILMP